MTVRENLTGVDRVALRKENMRLLREKLATGMTEDELNSFGNPLVAPGITARELIETRLDFEEIHWRKVDGESKLIKKSPEEFDRL